MRLAITLGVILIALGVVVAVFVGQQPTRPLSAQPSAPDPAPESEPAADADPAPEQDAAPPAVNAGPAPADAPPLVAPTPDEPASFAPILGLRAVPASRDEASLIGSLTGDDLVQVELSSYGAAIRYIRLARYFQTLDRSEPYVVQTPVYGNRFGTEREFRYPFAVRGVSVNGAYIDLQALPWRLVAPGHYEIDLVDADNRPVATLVRRYAVTKGSYDLSVQQRLINRTDSPLQVVWDQYGQGDVPSDGTAYMGDKRDIVLGHFRPGYDARRQYVYSDNGYLARQSLVSDYPGSADRTTTVPLWPSDQLEDDAELVWLAAVNRYFAAVVHRELAPGEPAVHAALQTLFPAPDLHMIGRLSDGDDTRGLLVRLRSRPLTVQPGATAELDLALFAGPREKQVFAQSGVPYEKLGFEGLVRYNLGGPCAFCTFQWLARGLLGFLKAIHFVTRDWGIAIIVLVLVVRAILHPITKKAQVNMMRMGKQMQALQPEIEKLKKKYKDDQQAMQKEMMALYREKGINPASALGCLPLFLQTPIWIALYAMLYYAIELRHQPAFYDVFNRIAGLFGGQWHFLSDLSTADHFIQVFSEPRQINLWFIHPNFQAINLLPILMGFTFFMQQKYLTPPPANEQAAQTQKMMKWMMLLFPLMLYSAPSGLTLYILASTGAGIVDGWLVRKHVKEMEERGELLQPKKPSGFMARMQDRLAEAQKQLEAQKARQGQSYKNRKR